MYVRQLNEDEMKQLMQKVKTSLGLSEEDVPNAPAPSDETKKDEAPEEGSTAGRSKEDVDRDRFKDLDVPRDDEDK
jgi:hypothetical protein